MNIWYKNCVDCKQSLGDKKQGYVPYANFEERGVFCNECEPKHMAHPLLVAWYTPDYPKARILYFPPSDAKNIEPIVGIKSEITRIINETWRVDMSKDKDNN